MTSRSTIQLTPAELLSVAAGGWGYAEAEWIDGWHARASGGFTNRANSAWPIALPTGAGGPGGVDEASVPGGPGVPAGPELAHTLETLRAWFAERGLLAQVQCVVGSELDRAVAACGYDRVEQLSMRMDARVDTLLAALAGHGAESRPGTGCVLTDRPDPSWLSVYRDGKLPPVASKVLGAGDDQIRFATITDDRDGTTLAIARGSLAAAPAPPVAPAADGPTGPAGQSAPAAPATWAGLAAVEVVPAARRRGLAKAVIRELIDWAAGRGATDVFLEVFSTNAAAVELYRTLGFSVHHAYHYRVIESILP